MHTPVFFNQVIEALNVTAEKFYVDATAGEGGFTSYLAQNAKGVLAIDWDEEQISNLRKKLAKYSNVQYAVANFADVEKIVQGNNSDKVDGIVFDLGLSMKQIAESGRGFSFKNDEEPLDMRINRGTTSVSDIINNYKFENLYELISRYSEELYTSTIVQAIVRARSVKSIKKVGELKAAIDQALEGENVNLIKVYSRVFQALRIEVNKEFDNLKKGLAGALSVIEQDGLIVVISFHSLEDRIVKKFAKENNLTFKSVEGSRRFVKSFERSAHVRVLRRR